MTKIADFAADYKMLEATIINYSDLYGIGDKNGSLALLLEDVLRFLEDSYDEVVVSITDAVDRGNEADGACPRFTMTEASGTDEYVRASDYSALLNELRNILPEQSGMILV